MPSGTGTRKPMPLNCVSSGVHLNVKSNSPVSPVLSTTGLSITTNCMNRAKFPSVLFLKLHTPRCSQPEFSTSFASAAFSFGPPFATSKT